MLNKKKPIREQSINKITKTKLNVSDLIEVRTPIILTRPCCCGIRKLGCHLVDFNKGGGFLFVNRKDPVGLKYVMEMIIL